MDRSTGRPLYLNELPSNWQGEAMVFPTADGSTFAWCTLIECLDAIAAHLENSRSPCYIHCLGGHGRAGIVAACLLGLAYDLSAVAALAATKRAHDCRVDPARPLAMIPPSPQTKEQCAQVM